MSEIDYSQEEQYWKSWAREYFERQKPGINRLAAQLHLNLVNTLLDMSEIQEDLMEVLGNRDLEEERQMEFESNGEHFKLIRNNRGIRGDFRLIRLDPFNQPEEEGDIQIREGDNSLSYWHKRFGIGPEGRRIFRGPNEPAAKKIQEMIDKLK